MTAMEAEKRKNMTPRDRFITALDRKPLKGRVPTFELVFALTMEKFKRIHPAHRNYSQWYQMSETEKQAHRNDIADIYIAIAEAYGHDAIFVHPNPDTNEEIIRLLETIREKIGKKYFLTMHGDPTYAIPDGENMYNFTYRIADDPDGVKSEAKEKVNEALEWALELERYNLLDGFTLCSDYCLNTGPFLSPMQFSEFVAPYLAKVIKGYRDMGYYTIKHTDGNIMPILDQLVQANPHALHSIDPQAGVDIAEVKRLVGHEVCLIGNVDCGLLQTGTEQQAVDSARYSLKHGMQDYGYIFSTSNCVYTGMPLDRYELLINVLDTEGIYK